MGNRTMFVSSTKLIGLDKNCDHSHVHLQLNGSGPEGSRTASAARYPRELCRSILNSISDLSRTTPDGGRNEPVEPPGWDSMTKAEQVLSRLCDAREIAERVGMQKPFCQLVDQWLTAWGSTSGIGLGGQPLGSTREVRGDSNAI